MQKKCPRCRQAKDTKYSIDVLGRSYSISHELGCQGDPRFSCAERAILKYFHYAMSMFFGAALKTLGNARRTKRERYYIVHSRFLQFLGTAVNCHIYPAFTKYLYIQNIEPANASLWQNGYFTALVVGDKIRNFWRKNSFERTFVRRSDVSQSQVWVRGKYGAYFEGAGSALQITFKETPNYASFSIVITSEHHKQ